MKAQDCIFFQLAKASQSGIRFWGNWVSRFNVTPVQGSVLIFLAEEDQTPSAHLGNRAQLDSATLTGILDRLEVTGLVERRKNPDDRRSILICLTPEGKRIAEDIRSTAEDANQAFFSNLSNEERQIFQLLLRKILS